jgi:hypothetical protein
MSLVQIFNYKSPNNKFVSIESWVATLPSEQQIEYAEALARQLARRQEAIDNGYLVVVKNKSLSDHQMYQWTDQAEFEGKNHGCDLIWKQYHDRWLTETNQELEILIKEG